MPVPHDQVRVTNLYNGHDVTGVLSPLCGVVDAAFPIPLVMTRKPDPLALGQEPKRKELESSACNLLAEATN